MPRRPLAVKGPRQIDHQGGVNGRCQRAHLAKGKTGHPAGCVQARGHRQVEGTPQDGRRCWRPRIGSMLQPQITYFFTSNRGEDMVLA